MQAAAGALLVLAQALVGVGPAAGAGAPLRTCWNQLLPDYQYGGIGSSFYPSTPKDYTQAADDVIMTSKCAVSQIIASGSLYGTAKGVNVYFYKHGSQKPAGRLPGATFAALSSYTFDASTRLLTVRLPHAVVLSPDTYWISVQVIVDGGGFLWSNVTQLSGSRANWRNPGSGSCTTWIALQDCLPYAGVDLSFELRGR